METTAKATERLCLELMKGNVGRAIAEMETYLTAWPQQQTRERLSAIKEDYERMAVYWRQGAEDPERPELYMKLLQRVYVLYANLAIYHRQNASSFLTGIYNTARQQNRTWSVSAIRSEMENFVSEVAMLELEPEHTRARKGEHLYRRHQQEMNLLFNYVLTSRMWTEGVGREFTDLLLSPTVDNVDQQLIIAAVMLSAMNQFDMVKFRLLTEVYRHSQDEYVRQRALVGWVLVLNDDWQRVYPEQRQIVAKMLHSEAVCKELTELQIQLIYSQNAENDTKTIQKEIMPDLLKNNQFRVTRNGLEEVEEDALEDVLHPEVSEQRMEKLEASFQRMVDMQKQGADIYFGGFSQMKRYPFFYDTSNWLVPFYLQHPDIAQFVKKLEGNRFLESIMLRGPFCNSDKYSFLIAFQEVVDRLPVSMRDLMARGEAAMGEFEQPEEQLSAAYIRRIYLMDLYRFFRLFPNRSSMENPFEKEMNHNTEVDFFSKRQFMHTPLEPYKREIVGVLMRYGYGIEAECLLDTFPPEMQDVQFFLWVKDYEAVLSLDPDNEKALAGRAREAFNNENYGVAVDDYEHLLLIHPGKVSYMLNKAVCLVKLEEYEDALKLLYQLNYEHADDDNVNRVLAWALTCDGKLAQAENLYQQLIAAEQPVGEDYMNYGYCLWLLGRVEEAARCIKKSLELTGHSYEFPFDTLDEMWLKKKGISEMEMNMMETLVLSLS